MRWKSSESEIKRRLGPMRTRGPYLRFTSKRLDGYGCPRDSSGAIDGKWLQGGSRDVRQAAVGSDGMGDRQKCQYQNPDCEHVQ